MREVTSIEILTFKSARGLVSLVVVGETTETYIVCTLEEFERARAAGEAPRVLGFRKADAVRVETR
jgi:hypothetical protein